MSTLRVRLWFGDHVIADYEAEERLAERFAAAVRRKFKGLRVTCEPMSEDEPAEPVPSKRWWEMVPR